MSFLETHFASLFMGFTDLLLLYFFSRKSGDLLKEKRWKHWGFFALCFLLYSSVQINATYESPLDYYLFVTAAVSAYGILIRFFGERDTKTAIYYAAIYYILSDCILHLVVRMGYRFCGQDLILYGAFPLRLFWNLLAFGVKGLCFYLLQLFLDRDSPIRGSLTYMLFLCLLPMLPYLYIRNITTWFPAINIMTAPLSLDLALILNAGCGIILLLGNEKILSNSRREQEKARIEAILSGQNAQYAARLAAAEQVNKSYHNLKHILRGIEALTEEEEVHRYIQSAFQEFGSYGNFHDSGNRVLDFLLNETHRRCREESIRFVPYADGLDWDLLEPMDLAILFGNAFDNAVESAATVKEPEKRLIHANIRRSEGFLLMRIHNYYDHGLERKNGKLLSTKKDNVRHGYGLDSIRSVAEKYGGELDIELEAEEFTLCVMIPHNRN